MKILLRTTLIALFLISLSHISFADASKDTGMIFNFNNVDIRSVIKSVSRLTGKNFIIDPAVKGKVTIISSKPLAGDEIYGVFLSILQVHNYTAIKAGELTKIIPVERAKEVIRDLDDEDQQLAEQFVTRIYQLEYVPANKLVTIIKPLMNPKGYLATHDESNSLIFIDTVSNVERIVALIKKIDRQKTADIQIIPLKYADARDVIRVLEGLEPKAKRGEIPSQQLKMISDERTNSILLSGPERLVVQAKTMVTHLDTPIEIEGSTRVVFLRHAIASALVPILTGIQSESSDVPKTNKKGSNDGRTEILIQADSATNALIITAPPSNMKSLLTVIKTLDIRRGQVMIEAIVAEVSTGKSADLGVQWRSTSSTANTGLIGGTEFTNTQRPSGGISNVSTHPLDGLSNGFNLGFFDGTTTILGTEIINLGALVSALSTDSDINILSTPSIVTLDNQDAEISVGENVPFATGSYTSSSSGTPDNPFTTYERQDVGIKLKIKPQINEGNTIRLEISQEVSKIIPAEVATGLQSTDTRSIQTTVVVDDQKIIVLGGLISDDVQQSVMKVPLLGDIPFLGALFRYTYSKHEKKNLMVFIRPVIIRDEESSKRITFDKYDYMRRLQQEFNVGGVKLLPKEKAPVLPVLELNTTMSYQNSLLNNQKEGIDTHAQ